MNETSSKPMNPRKIPIYLLTGFLGAGKTTFLNYILTEKHGEKIAVIVNEFGAIGVDQRLIAGEKEQVIEMSNGCICCSVRTDLVDTLLKLAQERGGRLPWFEYVIIETTGLADPVPLIQTFLAEPAVEMLYELYSVVVLVDAKHFSHQRKYLPLAEEQIACADVLIVNKKDLVSEKELLHLSHELSELNPTAKILEAEHGIIPLEQLWTVKCFDADIFSRLTAQAKAHDGHDHLEGITTMLLETDVPMQRDVFESWLEEVLQRSGPDMLRYKGFLLLQGKEDIRMILQGVHREYRVSEVGKWEISASPRTEIVLIGRNLEREWLERSFWERFHSSGARRHE